ncbi:broad-spectrum mercury transporter MerE [Thermoflexus hugenholtzii]
MLEDIRKVLGIALAVVTCPCHLPVTAPLLLGLLAGTSLGAYLSTHLEVLAAVSTALFLGGLALAAAEPGGRLRRSQR